MSSAITSLTGLKNFSLLSIPAVWVLSISAHFYAVSLTKGRFTNASPRDYLASISRKQNKSAIDHKYIRAEAAQQNGFENLGLYAAAIVAAHIAKLPAGHVNSLALGYVLSRLAYNVLYIFVTSEKLGELEVCKSERRREVMMLTHRSRTASLRSVSFLAGIGIIFKLFISSAYALSENQTWL